MRPSHGSARRRGSTPVCANRARALTAIAHFVARRYSESVEAIEGLHDPESSAIWYAVSLAQLGRIIEAKKAIADYRRSSPPYVFEGILRGFKHDEDREHFAEALRIAGLDEARD